MWSAKRWIALGLCLCSLPLAGCGETAKTIVLAPTPTPNMASVQAESCQYEVSRIDQPQIENGIAAYNWVSWYAPGEHAILCGGYDITDGAWIIERVEMCIRDRPKADAYQNERQKRTRQINDIGNRPYKPVDAREQYIQQETKDKSRVEGLFHR